MISEYRKIGENDLSHCSSSKLGIKLVINNNKKRTKEERREDDERREMMTVCQGKAAERSQRVGRPCSSASRY